MKKQATYILTLIFLLSVFPVLAQFNPKTICRVENGKIYFRIDLNWTKAQQKELIRLFDLDTIVVQGVYNGKENITVKGTSWQVVKLNDHLVELSKLLAAMPVRAPSSNDIIMLDDRWLNAEGAAERVSVTFGVNRFTRYSVFQYSRGIARFFLPGNLNAKQVFLSGSFNAWSTTNLKMNPCDSGWTISLKLLPGKYSYKYIIDGKWTPDPYNRLKESDTYDSYNSVLYCYNYLFRLKGYSSAHKVILAGSFNNWNEKELKMIPLAGGWALSLYLREGTYIYKYIVDDAWITDPQNELKRPDGKGNFNSVMGIGDSLIFRLNGFLSAKKVILSGNFNNWNEAELEMEKTAQGWQLWYVLGPGNYEYKFIVDGKWMTDPANPNSTGEGEYQNSVLAHKANHVFTLNKYPQANKVIVTGSFNGWNKSNFKMVKKGETWTFPIYLIPGKYSYKFIVDDEWILDPANELWETNEYGTGNSVLWVEPR
ncbi:MAG: glycogen-binding domain-containing protein [Bacteroidetes bacterium]|nr:glycogen-binding domain-containing protein [Bacteroidota bacterium]